VEYSRFIPKTFLQPMVECYWVVEGTDQSTQKIVPDGFSELIFHFGDTYQISINGDIYEEQSFAIAAGQLNRPVFLKPTGRSGVFGIKFKPDGLRKILGCDMHVLTNETFDLTDIIGAGINHLTDQIRNSVSNDQRIAAAENFLAERLSSAKSNNEIRLILFDVQQTQGCVLVRDLSLKHKISLRKIERLFLQHVGISAKQYARLVRFTYVHTVLQQPSVTKAEASCLSGYFDQAHFNKDFKQFTGESPDQYFNSNHALSDFFLNR
jgi:AraC-like DNA-binding protein